MYTDVKCPKCDKNDKVTLTNPEGLAASYGEADAKENDYFLDNEAYSDAKCWGCGHEFRLTGVIIWANPSVKDLYDALETKVIDQLKRFIEQSELKTKFTPIVNCIPVNVFDYKELVIYDGELNFLTGDGSHSSLFSECTLEDLVDIITKYEEDQKRVFEVSNIEYDTDGDEVDLPTTITVLVPKGLDVNDFISNEISKQTDFLHTGFIYKEIV